MNDKTSIQSALSALVPGSKTFRDDAQKVAEDMKTARLSREERQELRSTLDSLWSDHKAKMEEIKEEQKRNLPILETVIADIQLLMQNEKNPSEKIKEASLLFKGKLAREDRDRLWKKFDSLCKKNREAHSAFSEEQKSNAKKLQHAIDSISPHRDLFSDDLPQKWVKIREVSQMFKELKLIKTDRERLWLEFNKKCDEVKSLKKGDDDKSEYLKNQILHTLGNGENSLQISRAPILNMFHDVTDLRRFRAVINGCGEELSKNKTEMTPHDKQECFEAIQKARDYLNMCWEQYNAQNQAKHANWRANTEANIEKNRQKYNKQVDFLARLEANLEKNHEQLASAYSDGFREKVEGWIEDNESKIEDVKAQLERIENWIEEDELKLRGG